MPSTWTACGASTTTCCAAGCPVTSNGHRCRSAAIGGSSPNDAPAIEIAPARPREEFGAWLREQTDTPLDYEHGPAWHLAVLPFTDGGTGLSLVISHGLTDGVGLTPRWPTPPPAVTIRSAGRPPDHDAGGVRCARTPARLLATHPPSAGRSPPARGWPGSARREAAACTSESAPFSAPNEQIDIPAATVFIDIDEWDASPGTRRNQQLAAGRIRREICTTGRPRHGRRRDGHLVDACQRTLRWRHQGQCGGQRRPDGRSDEGDRRPPRGPRRGQAALIRAQDVPDERFALLPLVPFLPKRLVKKMVGVAGGGTTNCLLLQPR